MTMKRKILKKKYKTLCKLVLGGIAFFSSMFINQHNLKALPVVDPDTAKTPITMLLLMPAAILLQIQALLMALWRGKIFQSSMAKL